MKKILFPLIAFLCLITIQISSAKSNIDLIGQALTKSDGSTVTLSSVKVLWCGNGGQSFAIKSGSETNPTHPRLLVISAKPLPVENKWTVDVTGIIQTVSLSKNSTKKQRVLVVSPENIKVYHNEKGVVSKNSIKVSSKTTSLTNLSSVSSMSTGNSIANQSNESLTILPDDFTTSTPNYPEYIVVKNSFVVQNIEKHAIDTAGFNVKIWGRATQLDTTNHAYYITDGSKNPSSGIRIVDHTTDNLPSVNNFVIVSGFCGIDATVQDARVIHRFPYAPETIIY